MPSSSRTTSSPSTTISSTGWAASSATTSGSFSVMSSPVRLRSVNFPCLTCASALKPSSLGSNSHSRCEKGPSPTWAIIGSTSAGNSAGRPTSLSDSGVIAPRDGSGSRPDFRSAILRPDSTDRSISSSSSSTLACPSRCLINSHSLGPPLVLTSVHEPFSFRPRNVNDSLPLSRSARMRRLASSRSCHDSLPPSSGE